MYLFYTWWSSFRKAYTSLLASKLLFNCLIVILLCHLGLLGVNGGKGLAFELAAKLLDFLLVEHLLILDYFLHSLADIVDLVLEALIKLDLARNL